MNIEGEQLMNEILEVSKGLALIGGRMAELAEEEARLKGELFEYEAIQLEDIRSKETGGYLKIVRRAEGYEPDEMIKLSSDKIRSQLAQFGRIKEFAKYEKIKRESFKLGAAATVLQASLSGKQSVLKMIRAELENLP